MNITDYTTSTDSSLIEEERSNALTQSSSFYVPFQGDNPVFTSNFPSSQTQTTTPIEFNAPEASSDVKGIPSDPGVIVGNFWEQWHHTGTHGLNTLDVWGDYTGEGVRVGVLDDGFNYNHSELAPNFRTDLDYDTLDNDNDSINPSGDNHGTNVAQIIAGDDNGARSVGVAFDADIVGVRRGFGSQSETSDTLEAFEYALNNDFDIFNNSWGISSSFGDNTKINFTGTDTSEVVDAMQDLVSLGRDGLGTAIVFSAGNDRQSGQSSNYRNYQNSPYTITVGAINENGTFANFSEAGANLLVTAPGDSLYISNVADTSGASIISGTSFAAPAVAGVIALMYEANTDLGYRDVQEILAMSARQVDANGTGWAGEGWQFNGADNWNGGGMHFSHDYGYGNVDALAAVRMAETWNVTQTFANMTTIAPISAAPALSLPATGTVTTTINVTQDITIEQIIIDLDISHTRAGDLTITLTSPDGTDSILAHRIDNGSFTSIYGTVGIDFGFSSTAHWGEGSAGDWTLTIEDTISGNAGTLNDWSLSFLGKAQSNDDFYVYTNEYAGSSGARTLLSDTNGGVDTINAAAVSGNTLINLNFGGTIAGTIFVIEPGTVIENVYTGDGNDTLEGNSADNILVSGRGDDSITGGAGNDTIDGGAGSDTLTYSFNIADFLINLVDTATVALTHSAQGFVDTISNIENFIFSNGSYTRAELNAYVAGGGGGAVTFVNSRMTLGFDGGGTHRVDNNTAGGFTYTGADIGQTGSANVLSVNRSAISLTANVLETNAVDSVTIRNDDLRQITLDGFRSLYVDQDLATNGVTVNIIDAMRGRVDTGAGNDIINITTANVVAFDAGDIDTWTINSGAGDDDIVIGGTVTNMFSTIYLGAGNDDIDINNQGNDRVFGEDGNDAINLGNGADVAEGGAGDDMLSGEAGNDILRGGDDDDTLHGGAGFDLLEGGSGNDNLYGGDQADTIIGGDGVDTLYGGTGNDTLRGGNEMDFLNGEDGNDKIFGDGGNDFLYGGLGRDFIRGGDGSDNLYGNEGSDKLYGDEGDDWIYGNEGFDALYGGNGGDRLFGGDDNDRLYGQSGIDILDGGAGNDLLYAGSGTYDFLIGGQGADRLYGDLAFGQDIFILNTLDAFAERIYNFNSNVDVINLDNILEGYTAGVSDISDFVQFVDLGNGTTDLRINADGDAGGAFGRSALIYNDFGGDTAADLLSNGNLTIDQTFF